MALTCGRQEGLAEDAAALVITGGNGQRVQLATLQPREQVGRLGSGVVGTAASVFLGLEEVTGAAFRTGVPAHCDVVIAASCHCGDTSRWADGWSVM